jgi:hypothetical protein
MACIKFQFQSPKFWADLEISYYLSILPIERSHPKNAKFFPKFRHRTASEIALLLKTFLIEFHKC